MTNKPVFKFYAFDWDDNILHMPTMLFLDKKTNGSWEPVTLSTSDFALLRDSSDYRPRNESYDEMFLNFRDYGPNGKNVFLNDTKMAISVGDLGPSWTDLIECLTNGCLFSIITARGHESSTIRMGIEYIINNAMDDDDKYLMYNNLLKFAYFYGKNSEFTTIYNKSEIFSELPLVKNYLDNCRFVGVSCPGNYLF